MAIDFEAPYLDPDPWGYLQRWYEQRRRHLIAAILPQQALGDVLEIGCSTGLMAQLLAPRAQRWLGVDISEKAIALAQQNLAAYAHVDLLQADITQHWPSGSFDTYLMCDVGYYLPTTALHDIAKHIASNVQANTIMLLAHWRHAFAQVQTPTQDVHRIMGSASGLQTLARYADEDLLIELWSGNGHSVARTEGFL